VLQQNSEDDLPEIYILAFMSFPYFCDLIAGIFTFHLAYLQFKHDEEQEEELRKRKVRTKLGVSSNKMFVPQKEDAIEDEFKFPENYDVSGNLCAICYVKERNTVLYKCGHKALCVECANSIKARSNPKCPLCRTPVLDVIPIYS
jgi:hypothetical protein